LTDQPATIVQRLWSYCNVLRNDAMPLPPPPPTRHPPYLKYHPPTYPDPRRP